jgi:hypothetical protein
LTSATIPAIWCSNCCASMVCRAVLAEAE